MSETGYSRITLKVKDEWDFRETVKKIAESRGESVNGFMIRAIRDAAISCGAEFPVPVLESKKME